MRLGETLEERYRLGELLGEGGGGQVYKAWDGVLERFVAIKALPPTALADEHAVRLMKQEVILTQALNHPHIVSVFDFRTHAGMPFIVMEYVAGENLARFLRRYPQQRLDEATFLAVADQILSAISYAHAQSVIHRDLKPGNVMMLPGTQVKVTDFGIAARLRENVARASGRTTYLSVPYASPEQINGEEPSTSMDVYALGCMFYEMLSGHPPFWFGDVLHQHLTAKPPPLEAVSPAIGQAVMSCLAKNPGKRCPSVATLRQALTTSATPAKGGRGQRLAQRLNRRAPAPLPARAAREEVLAPLRVPSVLGLNGQTSTTSRRVPTVRVVVRQRRGLFVALLGMVACVTGLFYWTLVTGRLGPNRLAILFGRGPAQVDSGPTPQGTASPSTKEPDAPRQEVAQAPATPIPPAETAVAPKPTGPLSEPAPAGSAPKPTPTIVPPTTDEAPVAARRPNAGARDMVLIRGGTFVMGSPVSEVGRDPDENTGGNAIELADFYLDEAEVTNATYRQFVLANPAWQKGRIDSSYDDGNYLADWVGTDFPQGRADWPVTHVSWYAALAYAEWARKRLPTEAEWEYAARAGSQSPYWWGDVFDPRRVGPEGPALLLNPLLRSPWRLVNMIGGVWEWTSSRYEAYPYSAGDGREDRSNPSKRRVVRGGSFNSGERMLRSANRSSELPGVSSPLLGFRCAK